ncbi:MAG: response regulator [bacterium]|nr:response regulator [bacterium]
MMFKYQDSIQRKILINIGLAVFSAVIILLVGIVAIRVVNVCLVMSKAERDHTVNYFQAVYNFEMFVRTEDKTYFDNFNEYLDVSYHETRLFSTTKENVDARSFSEVAKEFDRYFPSADYNQCRDMIIVRYYFESYSLIASLVENTRNGNRIVLELKALADEYKAASDNAVKQNLLNQIYDLNTLMDIEANLFSDSVDRLSMLVISTVTIVMMSIIIIIALSLVFFIWRMIRPLRKLTKASVAIAEGDLNYEIDIKSSDEIGVFAESFTSMRNIIRNKIVELEREISERKQAEEDKRILEEQLLHSQKMESIGRLAGGVAHDFNNILVGIMGYAEVIKMKYPDSSSSEGQAADIIIQGAERAAELIRQLLGFARGGKYNPVYLDVNEIIKEIITMSGKIFEMKIDIHFDLEKDINTIEADKSQLNQVITNLIINAKDAMPTGGKLSLKTENTCIDGEHTKQYPNLKTGDYVKISITDSGIGIRPEIKENIFDPFFTTKDEGEGTGLGLATVYGIVENHGGQIEVISEPGEGATFILYFPATDKEIVESSKETELIRGDATILVVDDEEHVRTLTSKLLGKLGYNVLLAVNGLEALKIYSDNKENIDLVLLDMIMPEMDGKDTILKLKEINPDLRIVLSSGYSQDGKAADILMDGVLGFVQKPFRMGELSTAIAEALKQ